MFNSPFYHSTLRKLVASFGALFASIFVVKRSTNGAEIERIKVPLAYGPAEKYLVRKYEDPELNRNYSIKLPRMSFEIKNLEYDSSRKLNTLKVNTEAIPGIPNKIIRQYQGVPYKLNVELSIITKYIDDANQILEQILPWFTPAFTITVNSIPGMNYKDDIAITLTALNVQDNYEDDWISRRDIVWTLSFDIKATFYGPIADKEVITKVIADIYNVTETGILQSPGELQGIARISRTTVEPTVMPITYVEDYGYSQTSETFFDGLKRDPSTGEDAKLMLNLAPSSIESTETFGVAKLI